jgi:hypothetical protein
VNKKKWRQVEIENEIWVPFKWRDDTPGGGNLGRAEFQICLRFKRGKVAEYWAYPKQMRDAKECWHWKGTYPDFTISSYQNLEDAKTWLFVWCKEHKTQSMLLYIPREAAYACLDCRGISFWRTRGGSE